MALLLQLSLFRLATAVLSTLLLLPILGNAFDISAENLPRLKAAESIDRLVKRSEVFLTNSAKLVFKDCKNILVHHSI
jgi:hypothetical protein